jgi:hypothetical protein
LLDQKRNKKIKAVKTFLENIRILSHVHPKLLLRRQTRGSHLLQKYLFSFGCFQGLLLEMLPRRVGAQARIKKIR